MGLEFEELMGRIIAAAIEVHRQLGPGFLESVYEKALKIELAKRGIRFESQLVVKIYYDGVEVGEHRLDLLVEAEIVVELKAVQSIDDIHMAIAGSYLRSVKKHHGLILNFSQPKLEIRRVISK